MFATLVALSLAASPSLPEQVFAAKLVVEVQVPLTGTKPAWKARAVKQVLLPGGAEAPKELPLPVITLPPCKLALSLSYLVLFAQQDDGKWKALALDLQAKGRGTSLDQGYASLVDALGEAAHWHEERMRAVGEAQLWTAEKKALHADNPWLRALAAQFLRDHGAADVIDAEWGAPGSDARKAEEAKAALPAPACARR